MKNENGSTLLLVLIISLVFMTLGLSIISTTIGGTKRTEIRVTEVNVTSSSEKMMDQIVSAIQLKISKQDSVTDDYDTIPFDEITYPNELTGTSYDTRIQNLMDTVVLHFSANTNESVQALLIQDIRNFPNGEHLMSKYIPSYSSIKDRYNEEYFTRVYRIHLEVEEKQTGKPTIKRTLYRDFVLSPTPSFFQFATGSLGKERVLVDTNPETYQDKDVNGAATIINGSPDIIGNLFSSTLSVSKNAKYTYEGTNMTIANQYGPSIYGNLFVNDIQSDEENPFYGGFFTEAIDPDINISGIPAIKPTGNDFVDMNFDQTFLKKREETKTVQDFEDIILNMNSDYLQALIKLGRLDPSDPGVSEGEEGSQEQADYYSYLDTLNNHGFTPFIKCNASECGDDFYIIEKDWLENKDWSTPSFVTSEGANVLLFVDIETTGGSYSGLKHSSTLTMDDDLYLGENGWLVVDGNLQIISNHSPVPKIDGNILVVGQEAENNTIGSPKQIDNGNLRIVGNYVDDSVKFDSTVYVEGDSSVYNTNIEGICSRSDLNCYSTANPENQQYLKELVLISRGPITISRINELSDVSSTDSLLNRINEPPNLKAFFYTESRATLFGVGSLFDIEGGLFARAQLTINAVRGNIEGPPSDIYYNLANGIAPTTQETNSRFYVEFDGNVLTNQLSALPRVDRLQMIVDDLVIK